MAPLLNWITGRPNFPGRRPAVERMRSLAPSFTSYTDSDQTLGGEDDTEDPKDALLGVTSPTSSCETSDASVLHPEDHRALRIYSVLISIACIGLAIFLVGYRARVCSSKPLAESMIASEPYLSPVSTGYKAQETCGSSIAEAKAKGCQYDDLIKAWLPSACPRHGTKEFQASGAAWVASQLNSTLAVDLKETGSWPYFNKLEKPVQMTPEEVAGLGDKSDSYPGPGSTWFSSHREHLHHCAWVLKRLSNAYSRGLRADDQTRSYPHIDHCVNIMLAGSLQAPGVDEVITRGNVWFGSC
jgi:hypothetical protein